MSKLNKDSLHATREKVEALREDIRDIADAEGAEDIATLNELRRLQHALGELTDTVKAIKDEAFIVDLVVRAEGGGPRAGRR